LKRGKSLEKLTRWIKENKRKSKRKLTGKSKGKSERKNKRKKRFLNCILGGNQ